jgi:topoisomerase-4 subunit A
LNLPKGARVLAPSRIIDTQTDKLVAVTTEGRILVFPVSELPVMARGKGNKIIGIPPARVAAREEYVIAVASVPVKAALIVQSGKRHLKLKGVELDEYVGERGRRGRKLPRGFQKVNGLSVDL